MVSRSAEAAQRAKTHGGTRRVLSRKDMATQANNTEPEWQGVCAQETERHDNMMRVSMNHTCSNMEDCLGRLKRTIYARETLRNRVRLVQVDESAFEICTSFGNATRFCELGYGVEGPIAKKSCLAPSACYRFDLHTILEWAHSMASIGKSRNVCNVAMRGHTLACNDIPRLDEHTMSTRTKGILFGTLCVCATTCGSTVTYSR